jgi:hypothetical protein
MTRNLVAALAASIGAVTVVAMGFTVLGGPQHQRSVRTDQRTVQAISSLARQINDEWRSAGKTLPANLDEFPESARRAPSSGAPLSYRLDSPHEYELCARFAGDDRDTPGNAEDRWIHPQGDYCFSFDPAQPVSSPPYWNF